MERIGQNGQRGERRLMGACVILAVLCFFVGLYVEYGCRLHAPVFVEISQVGEIRWEGTISPEGEAGQDGAILPEGEAGQDGAILPEGETGQDGVISPEGKAVSSQLVFYYITDRADERYVSSLEFPELGKTCTEILWDTAEESGRYALHQLGARLTFSGDFREKKRLLATRAKVSYSDGSFSEESVGNLLLLFAEEERAVKTTSVSASSNGRNGERFQFHRDGTVRLKEIIGLAAERANFSFFINGEMMDAEGTLCRDGIPVKAGEQMEIESQWLGEAAGAAPQRMTSPILVLEFDGEKTETFCYQAEYNKSYELRFGDVWRFLYEKGVF